MTKLVITGEIQKISEMFHLVPNGVLVGDGQVQHMVHLLYLT